MIAPASQKVRRIIRVMPRLSRRPPIIYSRPMEVRGRSRWLAALRTLLVAVCVCLLGAASRSDQSGLAADLTLQDAGSAHAEAIGLPLPGPAVVEESGEDPRSAEEDDALAHGPRTGLPILAPCAAGVHMIRGPPAALGGATWQPRSSRGPPAQV